MTGHARAPRRLLRTPQPLSDESLLGYLLRLTESNYYDSPRWILELVGWRFTLTNSSWLNFFKAGADFTHLALATGIPEPELERLGYRFHQAADRLTVFGAEIPASALWTGSPKLCPRCLVESAHCRKLWELEPVTACHLHHTLLINRCPGCRRRLTWDRSGVCQCRCGSDWRGAQPPEVDQAETDLARRVAQSCQLATTGRTEGRAPTDDPGGLDLYELNGQLSLVANYCTSRQDGYRLTPSTDLAVYHEAYVDAYTFLSSGPQRRLKFFEKYLVAKDGTVNAASFLPVLDQLEGWRSREDRLHFRFAFESFLREQWAGTAYHGLLRLPPYRNLISREEARHRLGLSHDWFELLVQRGGLTCHANEDGQWIDLRSVERLQQSVAELLSVGEAAHRLNLTEEGVVELARQGLLRAESGPAVDGFSLWRFTRQGLTELAARIHQMVPEGEGRPAPQLLRAASVSRRLKRCGLSGSDFLRDVLGGRVAPYPMAAAFPVMDRDELLRVGFCQEEVERYVKERQPAAEEEPVSWEGAARWLDRRFERNERVHARSPGEGASVVVDLRRMAESIFASYRFREWEFIREWKLRVKAAAKVQYMVD